MATTPGPSANGGDRAAKPSRASGPRRLRWNARKYGLLTEKGFFERTPVELIAGEIFEMSPISPLHAAAVERVDRALRVAFGPGHRFRIRQPIALGSRSRPEPDLVVIPGEPGDDPTAHPTSASLVVEVSDASLGFDRRVKAALYARAGLPEFWLLNLVERQLEVHRQPGPDPARPGRFRYQNVAILPPDGLVIPLAAPGASVEVCDLLPATP